MYNKIMLFRSMYASVHPAAIPQKTKVVQQALLIVGNVSIDHIINIP